MSKYGVISGLYFPVFGLNTEKYRPEITPYLDTFLLYTAVFMSNLIKVFDIIRQVIILHTLAIRVTFAFSLDIEH